MVLRFDQLESNPMDQFAKWYNIVCSQTDIRLPNAMCISTVDNDGYPDSRWVLMKDYDDKSLVFYTNLDSTKSKQLQNNNKIAINFYWPELNWQVRMRGQVELVDENIADDYFATRSRPSQLGAWASKQSKPLSSKEELNNRLERYSAKFKDNEIPRPDFWSGYRVIPFSIEFWESGENRLHDRFQYNKQEGTEWKITRLYP